MADSHENLQQELKEAKEVMVKVSAEKERLTLELQEKIQM
jgi:hypothetical protein